MLVVKWQPAEKVDTDSHLCTRIASSAIIFILTAVAKGSLSCLISTPVCEQKPGVREGSHTDAILGLSWNTTFRNVLASGSADKHVKVWDVATQQCQATLGHHTGKVQAVAWNPAEPPVLLSGGYDHRLCLVCTPLANACGC